MGNNADWMRAKRKRWSDIDHSLARVYVHNDIKKEVEDEAREKNLKYVRKLAGKKICAEGENKP